MANKNKFSRNFVQCKAKAMSVFMGHNFSKKAHNRYKLLPLFAIKTACSYG